MARARRIRNTSIAVARPGRIRRTDAAGRGSTGTGSAPDFDFHAHRRDAAGCRSWERQSQGLARKFDFHAGNVEVGA